MVFLPIIVILGVFSLLSENKKPQEESGVKDAAKVVSVANTIVNTTDTDSDGVPDWEEIIWKTDPNKAETFGKPDRDHIQTQMTLSKSATSTSSGAIMGSEDLTKQLFNRYVALQASGELNDATISSMTEDIAQNIKINAIEKPFTRSNLTTFPDSNASQLDSYAKNFSAARAEFQKITDAATSGKTFTPGDASFETNMLAMAKIYEDFAKTIVALQAPEGVVDSVLIYLNAMKASAQSIKQIANMNSDPLQSLLGLKTLTIAETAQDESLATIISFFNQNGIITSGFNSQ